MKAGAAERSAKQESQLLQQPANAAELHGATSTQPSARQTTPATCLAALLYVALDSPQVCSSTCLIMAQLGILSRGTDLR